jgi:hypothetical protein
MMTKEEFRDLIAQVTGAIEGRALNAGLQGTLNSTFAADSSLFGDITAACHAAIAEGWMCAHEAGGVAYGRVIKPGSETHGFSVDVVCMKDLKGPHHAHPNGEIDMIMPIDAEAKFDGCGAGWLVYDAASAHSPTVSDGEALVLYLLPDGAIEFSR